ncbi:MAG: FecR domain-containing protein, partial [Verrucomicrobiae bacterium]|nr:FecR domain-containing protein [Verrucomicrobiae bacterium]
MLSALADGLLDEDGEKRLATILRQDPGARQYYLNYLGLTAALQWEYADAAAAPPAPVAVQKPAWRRWAVPLASAAVAILGLFLLLRPAATPLIAMIEFTDGAALWTDASGSGDRPVEPGTALPAGTLRLEGASASAQVRFSDNTLITLNGESDVSISDQDRKRLVLRRGNLTASVTPQPDESPLTITTPAAEIEVIGTILAVEADSDQTSVMVDSGRVRVRRLADGKSIEVGEGRKTKVSLDRSADLTALPAIASPETWDSDLTTGTDRFGIGHSVTVLGKACL